MKLEHCMILLVCCYFTQTTAKCPSADVVLACSCENDNIYCGGDDYYDLRNTFVSISSALSEEEKHFTQFYFNNTAINELVFNVFYDITFEWIFIDSAYSLTTINTHAFTSTNFHVILFFLHNTPYGKNVCAENNIFNAINSMLNVDSVEIYNTSLTSIPSNAFAALPKLGLLNIINNPYLTSLGSYAFYDLNSISHLTLERNPLDIFPEHAFSFRNSSIYPIAIYFDLMPNLTSNSFSVGMFTTIRPFILHLQNEPQLKYLPENIFKDVLANGNLLQLGGTPLVCDCQMYWVYKNRAVYESLVRNSICTDGKSAFAARDTYNDCDV